MYSISNMKYDPLFRLRVTLAEKFLKYSYLSWERMERVSYIKLFHCPSFHSNTVLKFFFFLFSFQEHMTDVLTGKPGLEDLGVTLTNLEDRAHYILRMFLKKSLKPFTVLEPPPVATS